MDLQSTAIQMAMLFLVIALGFTIKKLNVIEDSFDGQLSKLVLTVTLPCLIVSSALLSAKPEDPSVVWMIVLCSTVVQVALVALGFLVPWLLRFKKEDRGTYGFMIAFGNVGFIGFPVLGAIFGPEAIVYAAIFNIPFNVFMFTVGVFMISPRQENLKARILASAKNIVGPTTLSCFAAMFITLFEINASGVLTHAFELVGQITIPAALILIGSTLARYRIREMLANVRALVATVFRLVVAPLAVYFIFVSFIDNPLLLGTMVLLSAMPVATNGTLFCLHYGGNMKLMLQGTFLTTLLSIISIPLITTLFV